MSTPGPETADLAEDAPDQIGLCTSGDHELAATDLVKVSIAGTDRETSSRVASPPFRRKRNVEDRAARARAFPPGTREAQMARLNEHRLPR